MWRFVDNLEAKDPKIFPLIPIAPGIITKSPGNVSRKKVILPKIIPAHKSPMAQISKAIRLSFITDLCSPTKSGNVENIDSGLRIFFCLSVTNITTYNHFYSPSLRLLILLEYLQENKFLLQAFQVNPLQHLFLLKLMCHLQVMWYIYQAHKSMMNPF